MIYTLGFNTIITGTYPIDKDLCLLNEHEIKDSYVLINATGAAREKWLKLSPISSHFYLESLSPSQEESEQINEFLYKGGTVISTLEDPNKWITTMAFKTEISDLFKDSSLKIRDYGEFLELEYNPYSWLDKDLQMLAEKAFNFWQQKGYELVNGAEIISKNETISFLIGKNNGKLIFTNLLKNNSIPKRIDDFTIILNAVLGKEIEYVTSR